MTSLYSDFACHCTLTYFSFFPQKDRKKCGQCTMAGMHASSCLSKQKKRRRMPAIVHWLQFFLSSKKTGEISLCTFSVLHKDKQNQALYKDICLPNRQKEQIIAQRQSRHCTMTGLFCLPPRLSPSSMYNRATFSYFFGISWECGRLGYSVLLLTTQFRRCGWLGRYGVSDLSSALHIWDTIVVQCLVFSVVSRIVRVGCVNHLYSTCTMKWPPNAIDCTLYSILYWECILYFPIVLGVHIVFPYCIGSPYSISLLYLESCFSNLTTQSIAYFSTIICPPHCTCAPRKDHSLYTGQ